MSRFSRPLYVGLVTDSSVEFFCRHCHVNVTVDLRISKAEKLAKIGEQITEVARLLAGL